MQKYKKDVQTQANGIIMEEPVMNKMKAIYMYSLGPNNAHVNIENNEYFSNQVTRFNFCNLLKLKHIKISASYV